MKKWFLTLMCMLAASVVMVGCSANTMSTAPTASPMTTTAAPTNSPMATAEATAEPAPAATMEAMTPAQAGQLAEKIAQAVQQISEIDEAQVVVNNDRALVAVRFDAQYNAGLDDRMKQQITETVQKVDDGLKDVEITDDDTLYGQIKGLGERVANVTGLDELADDFGDLLQRTRSAGERNKRIAPPDHLGLALGDGFRHDQLRQTVILQVILHKQGGLHAGHGSARIQNAFGNFAHQPGFGAAIHQRVPALANPLPQFLHCPFQRRVIALVGSQIYCDLHRIAPFPGAV